MQAPNHKSTYCGWDPLRAMDPVREAQADEDVGFHSRIYRIEEDGSISLPGDNYNASEARTRAAREYVSLGLVKRNQATEIAESYGMTLSSLLTAVSDYRHGMKKVQRESSKA